VTFDELYTVSVTTDSEVRDPRADAIRRGMMLLLTRITGRQQAAAYPELRELIDNAGGRYYAGYDNLSGNEVRVSFNAFEVNQTLTRLNMPIWGDERPATLLWLAADFGDGERAELMADDRAAPLRAGAVAGVPSQPLSEESAALFDEITGEILRAADERGLPIVLPELDAEDRAFVRFADVWGGFDQFVERAAERYDVEAILIARVVRTGLGTEVHWTARRGDLRETLTTPRPRMGIDWLADEFAAQYTTVGGARITFVTIRGIRSWTDWRVVDALSSLSIVESAVPDSIAGDELVLRVAARGDDEQLARLVTLDGRLRRVEDEPGLVFAPASTGVQSRDPQ
jgi:hypothetical protein